MHSDWNTTTSCFQGSRRLPPAPPRLTHQETRLTTKLGPDHDPLFASISPPKTEDSTLVEISDIMSQHPPEMTTVPPGDDDPPVREQEASSLASALVSNVEPVAETPTTSVVTPERAKVLNSALKTKATLSSMIKKVPGVFKRGKNENPTANVASPKPAVAPGGSTELGGPPADTVPTAVSTEIEDSHECSATPLEGSDMVTQPVADATNELSLEDLIQIISQLEGDKDRKKKSRERLEFWLAAVRQLLDVTKEAAGAVPSIFIVGPIVKGVAGSAVVILKCLESVIAVDKKWKGLLAPFMRHMRYIQSELGASVSTAITSSDSPGKVLLKAYANDLLKVIRAYLIARGLDEAHLEPGKPGTWDRIRRFLENSLTPAIQMDEIAGLQGRLTETLQNYERSKTSYLVDSNSRREQLDIDRLLRPDPADTWPEGGQHTRCYEGTRQEILSLIEEWVSSSAGPSLYMLSDAAGIGKSSVAYSLARKWHSSQKKLAASFFFSRDRIGVSTPLDLMRHVLWSLRQSYPQVKYNANLSEDAIRQAFSLHTTEERWEKLVEFPLSLLKQEADIAGPHFILVIDALDECCPEEREALLRCLQSISATHSKLNNLVKVLVTARPEPDIKAALWDPLRVKVDSLEAHDLDRADVRTYIEARFEKMNDLGMDDAQRLAKHADGLFIFAATGCDLLTKSKARSMLLKGLLANDDKPRMDRLIKLYMDLMQSKLNTDKYSRKAIRGVFSIIVVARRSLLVSEIQELVADDWTNVAGIVSDFESILGGVSEQAPIYIRHPTFREFLLDSESSGTYAISAQSSHQLLASSCLSLMQRKLHPDMFRGTETSIAAGRQLQNYANSTLVYAASNWMHHTSETCLNGTILQYAKQFFEAKLLNWVEMGGFGRILVSFMQQIGQLQTVIVALLDSLRNFALNEILIWCNDTLSFLRRNQILLEKDPQQVYFSALAWDPCESLVYRNYEPRFRSRLPEVTLETIDIMAGLDSMELLGHQRIVECVAYSRDGSTIVSTAFGGHIVSWDAQTGAMKGEIKLEGAQIGRGIGLSQDQKTILYISREGLLYRINTETMALLCLPEKLSNPGFLDYLAWGPDCTGFAFSVSQWIYYHNLETEFQPIEDMRVECRDIRSLSLSRDGTRIASISGETTVTIWEITQNQLSGLGVVFHHTRNVMVGTFCSDGSSLFAFMDARKLNFYCPTTRNIVLDLDLDLGDALVLREMLYSRDGKHIAMRAMPNDPLYLVDATNQRSGKLAVKKLNTGHWVIECFAFSPDCQNLVTGGEDGTFCIRDLTSARHQSLRDIHGSRCDRRILSFDSKYSASTDAKSMALSSDGLVVAYERYRFPGGPGVEIVFWSLKAQKKIGKLINLEKIYPYGIEAMVFSPDDTKLAITYKRKLILLDVRRVHEGTEEFLTMVALGFPPGELKLAYHPSGDYICCGGNAWNVSNNAVTVVTFDTLGILVRETFYSFLVGSTEQLTSSYSVFSIRLGTPPRQRFYIPTKPNDHSTIMNGGFFVFSDLKHRMITVDFTPFATEEENGTLSRLGDMRRNTLTRLGPSQLHDVLSSYGQGGEIILNLGA